MYFILLVVLCSVLSSQSISAFQTWLEQPGYQEVNPGGEIILPCIIQNKKGQCQWEKDGYPVGMHPQKYSYAGDENSGDCSLRINDANLEYDDGVWQCRVTSTSFKSKDYLISEGAQIVVREPPQRIEIVRIGDENGDEIIASAGEDLELECITIGGNPPSKLRWFTNADDREILSGHSQKDIRQKNENEDRTWISKSRLVLPVSKDDNGRSIRCEAQHPALDQTLLTQVALTIHYPPTVRIETSELDYLEEDKDEVTLRCQADSNPASNVVWRKAGVDNVFSREPEISFSPITRQYAGLYSCTAQNALGLSQQAIVDLDIKYAPRILSVGPRYLMEVKMYNSTVLTCSAEGNPAPRYQWLQEMPTGEVLIRGYSKDLIISNVTYDSQGNFVCKAINDIRGEPRSVQSEAIRIEVNGAPQIPRYSSTLEREVLVKNGENAVLEVFFCSDPMPKQSWHLGDLGSGTGNNIILAAGTGHGRFLAEKVRSAEKEDCYVSALHINGAHPTDSHVYELRVSNEHGHDSHQILLKVRDRVSQESLIAVVVGGVLTLLIMILIVIYMIKADKCCCCSEAKSTKNFKTASDIESEKTDVESTHSSNLSGLPIHGGYGRGGGGESDVVNGGRSIILPDALYYGGGVGSNVRQCSSMVANNQQQLRQNQLAAAAAAYHHNVMFNDSKESLRPDLNSPSSLTSIMSSFSTYGSPNIVDCVPRIKVSYNDLCFPKTSNYGSMKKKKHARNVGVNASNKLQGFQT